MSAINDEMTFVSRDCKSILDICDKIADMSRKLLADEKTGLLKSGQLAPRLPAGDRQSETRDAARLLDAPVVARVVCKDETHRTRIFYTTPCAPPAGLARANLSSVYSAFGRLSVLPPGAGFVTPKGETLLVTERCALKPVAYGDGRDVFDTLFESLNRDRLRVKSLRDFARVFGEGRPKVDAESGGEPPLVPAEELDIVLDEGETRPRAAAPVLGQPHLLDIAQDEVLRRPFAGAQVILGHPGAGKTTTLVRRLDFLLSREALEAGQTGLSDKLDRQAGGAHAGSWCFITSREPLGHYVRESLAGLGVPLAGENVFSWDEARLELAGDYFRILSSRSRFGLVLSPGPGGVTGAAEKDTLGWYEDFKAHHRQRYFQAMTARAGRLAAHPGPEVAALGRQLGDLLARGAGRGPRWLRNALAPCQEALEAELEPVSQRISDSLRGAFEDEAARDEGLVAALVALGDGGGPGAGTDARAGDLFRSEAARIYTSAVRERARALAGGRPVAGGSRSARVLDWLGGGRLGTVGQAAALGADLRLDRDLRSFHPSSAAFANAYFGTIVGDYLLYRRRDRVWYDRGWGAGRKVSPLEVDLLLLSFLEPGWELLRDGGAGGVRRQAGWSLAAHSRLLRNVVCLDDLADLSPVQIKIAACLADPRLGSVAAAGDLELRAAPWGLKTLDELEWALPRAALTELAVNYRQSRTLLELTDTLGRAMLPRYSGSRYSATGPRCVLSAGVDGPAKTLAWLTARLAEVAERLGKLPSTAVLVAGPEEVGPLAEALAAALAPKNIRVRAVRPDGAGLGQGQAVRVMTVDDARGLEFEVVLVVVPGGAPSAPAAKSLYLAATRAATYLGLASGGPLPSSLENVLAAACADWAQPRSPFDS
ncbi:MAG: ATP-binding domain-containing protein [Deltaproteobacteria bacterium]|jgi:hypothetical protein|nr:ATP-binding domain-containing protein [Deltaproteobacteria bacterium]